MGCVWFAQVLVCAFYRLWLGCCYTFCFVYAYFRLLNCIIVVTFTFGGCTTCLVGFKLLTYGLLY